MDKPPLLTLAYPKKLAFDMVEELAKLNPKREYDVVSWEDAI